MEWLGAPAVKKKKSSLIGNKQDKSIINYTSVLSLRKIFCWQVRLGRTAALPPSFVFSVVKRCIIILSFCPHYHEFSSDSHYLSPDCMSSPTIFSKV